MLIDRWLRNIRKKTNLSNVAHQIYFTTVSQSRKPTLFSDLEVPDTLDGRFDLVILHISLVLRRLRSSGESGKQLSDALFTVMFDDLDQTIREMGVGDIRVGKKVKAMARAFYGRCLAYDSALDSNDNEALEKALCKNIYGLNTVTSPKSGILSHYVKDVVIKLDTQKDQDLLEGRIKFPQIDLN